MILFHLHKISRLTTTHRSFSKGKRLNRVKKAGSGRDKRQSSITSSDETKPEWQGLGWSPVLFLGVAPLVAWIGIALIRPDLRKQLYEKLGYTDVREHEGFP